MKTIHKNFQCRVSILLFVALLSISPESKAIDYLDHTYIPVQTVVQEQTLWCWAAAALAIIYYYDGTETVRQCDIVNWKTNKTDSCDLPTPGDCNLGLNDGLDSEDNILEHWGVSATSTESAFIAWESGFYLWAEKPFVFRWEWDSGSGHALVAIGFQAANGVWGEPIFLSFLNPGAGSSGGKWTAFHDWVVDGDGDPDINQSSHVWTHTTYVHPAAPDDVTLRKTYEYVNNSCVEVLDDNAWYYYANDELTAKEFKVTTKSGDTNPLTDQMLDGCTWYSAGTRVRLKPGFQVDSDVCFRAFTD